MGFTECRGAEQGLWAQNNTACILSTGALKHRVVIAWPYFTHQLDSRKHPGGAVRLEVELEAGMALDSSDPAS
jgi:hypothetical protein